jgi:hypothetical protein
MQTPIWRFSWLWRIQQWLQKLLFKPVAVILVPRAKWRSERQFGAAFQKAALVGSQFRCLVHAGTSFGAYAD